MQLLPEVMWRFFSAVFPKNAVVLMVAAGEPINQQPVGVSGMLYHAVQLKNVGGNSYKVQGSLDGTNYVDISTISSDGVTQFTGLYEYIRVTKASGSGTTATMVLRSRP